MLNGTEEHRKAIIQASEVVGQLAKYSFIGIAYLGISLAVAIKLGDRTIKIIKSHIPQEQKKEGDVTC